MSTRASDHLSLDPVMSGLIERIGPIRSRPRRLPPFQSLAHAIIHQQLNSIAAGTILDRFKRLFPDDEFPAPGRVAKASVDRLRTAGLSRPKAAYIIDLAKRCNAGLIPSLGECDPLPDEEIIARLTEIKGIGRWTVEMLLIFTLGLFRLVINALLLYFVSFLLGRFFEVDSFRAAFLGALVISIVSILLNLLVGGARVSFMRRRPPPDSGRGGNGPVIDI